MEKVFKHESDDVWLRTGVRVFAFLVITGAALLAVIGIESAVTGEVSLITGMSGFAFMLCSLLATPLAVICIVTGLVRRYFRKQIKISYSVDSN